MDFIIEFIIELFFEGILEVGTNKKVPKWIRYPLLLTIISFYLLIIGCLFIVGINALKTKVINGLIILLIDLFLVILIIYAFKKKIKEKNN